MRVRSDPHHTTTFQNCFQTLRCVICDTAGTSAARPSTPPTSDDEAATAMLRSVHCTARRVRQRRYFSSEDFARAQAKANSIMGLLERSGETVGVAELASGGLISATLWTSPQAQRTFKGAGVRLAYGINREADIFGRERARDFAKEKMTSGFSGGKDFESSRVGRRESARWGLVYENGVPHSKVGSAVHALELAHAAKFNLGTTWGVGESCVAGPEPHHRTGQPAGSGFVAVAGPGSERTGVLKLGPSDAMRSANMLRVVTAALDLLEHLQAVTTSSTSKRGVTGDRGVAESMQEAAGNHTCAECNSPMAPTDLFCGRCGARRELRVA